MITIEESGMCFGPYDEKQIFHIEKTDFYKKLKVECGNVRTVEFIYFPQTGGAPNPKPVYFVEAKSSTPNPIRSQTEWMQFEREIEEKFLHSFELFLSALMGRNFTDEKCAAFKTLDPAQMHLVFILVINGHREEWLPPITEKLNKKLKAHRKIWRSEVIVLNHETAKKYDLLSRKRST